MAIQFINKRFRKSPKITPMIDIIKKDVIVVKPTSIKVDNINDNKVEEEKPKKNKREKKHKDMITKEQLSAIENAVENINPTVKVVKQDRGLIERTESSKIIITEDNRQVLND